MRNRHFFVRKAAFRFPRDARFSCGKRLRTLRTATLFHLTCAFRHLSHHGRNDRKTGFSLTHRRAPCGMRPIPRAHPQSPRRASPFILSGLRLARIGYSVTIRLPSANTRSSATANDNLTKRQPRLADTPAEAKGREEHRLR